MRKHRFIESSQSRPLILIITTMIAVAALTIAATPAQAASSPNPAFPDSCALDVVLVLDSSSSIDSTELTQMKTAMTGFVNAFIPATDSQFAVVTFAALATDVGSGWSGDAPTVAGWINSITSGSGTNWQQGLSVAYDALPNRDDADFPNLVIFASDGNPNHINNPSQSVTGAAAVAAAVDEANAIKDDYNTRIVAIGIGNNLNTTNLEAISSADAVVTSAFDTLASDLATLIQQNCSEIPPSSTPSSLVCVDGHSVASGEGTVATNDCAPVRICADGESMTVTEFEYHKLLADSSLDVSRGSCTPQEGPPPTQTPPTPIPPILVPTQEVQGIVATPTPEVIVESVTPPSTGDGGLVRGGTSPLYVPAVGALALLSLAALILRRRGSREL
jgi:von Willebrand factor type A domain